ncbi:MAG: YvcK family protein, partial [Anaerolineae bacterium]|nr:YvcK family protein [Anaerolineae bacterium]
MAGVTSLSLGLAYLLVAIYRQQPLPEIFYYLTLQFVPREWRALLFGVIGLVAVGLAVYRLNRSLLAAFWRPGHDNLANIVFQHRQRARGPKVVAIGGGTGLSTLLRGMKEYSSNLTAIITVADDGGSSGRLRRELGVLPPGDFRNCIAALADAEPLMTELLQYRFGDGMGLNGHSFGNLFIAAMAGVTGNFERAVAESSRVLAVRGRILPSTLEH